MASNFSGALSNGTFNNSLPVGCPDLNSATSKLIKVIACTIILILAVFGNGLVMVVTRQASRRKNTINALICNMAAADFVFAVFVVSRMIIELYSAPRRWYLTGLLGSITCKVAYVIQDTCTFVSIFTLVAIATERYYAVVHPMKLAQISAKVHRTLFLLIWVCSCGISAPYFYTWRLQYKNGQSYCKFDGSVINEKAYALIVASFGFMLPLLLLVFMYAKIIWTLQKKSVPCNDMNNVQLQTYRERRNKKVLKLAVAVLLAFIVCWLPIYIVVYFIHLEWTSALSCAKATLISVTIFLAYSNAAINPAVYFLFSENIRNGALLVLRCKGRGKGKRNSGSTQSTSLGTASFIKARTLVMSIRLDTVKKETRHLNTAGSVELRKFGNSGSCELGHVAEYDVKEGEGDNN